MKKLVFWYYTKSRRSKLMLATLVTLGCLLGVGIIGYTVIKPRKIEVRYGTIVRDPVDGRVWEDNTRKAWVEVDEADKYSIRYVDRLSPEHERQLAEEEARKASEEAQREQLKGLEKVGIPLTSQELLNMQLILQNTDVMGVNIVQGIELANALNGTKSKLVGYRNQIAATPVAPQVASFKERVLTIYDKYIRACDLYLMAMTEVNPDYMEQANVLINEANDLIPRVSSNR